MFHFSISGISSAGEARLYNALTAAGDYSEIRTALNWSQDWKLPEAGMRFDTGLTLALLTGGVATVAYLIEE